MTGSGPLGRDSMKFEEKMARYHAAMENALYAAELCCPNKEHKDVYKCKLPCPFHSHMPSGYCTLICFRGDMGDRVIQHDPTPPPIGTCPEDHP